MSKSSADLLCAVVLTAIVIGCSSDGRSGTDEGLGSKLANTRETSCAACPACAASMVCLEGATLQCEDGELELYSPIACIRPDGTKHGQYKSFERIEGRWIETDGWYVDDRPVGHWVSVDATGRVVKVISYLSGEPVEMRM